MSAVMHAVTADELFMMPRDGFRYELVKGELRKMSPAGSEHGAVIVNLTIPLGQYVRTNGRGIVFGAETGFKLAVNPDTVRAPDIAFVSRDRIPASGLPKAYFPGPPDLAVEVLSPGDTAEEVQDKLDEWLVAGTKLVWVVSPKHHSVTIYRSLGAMTRLHEDDVLEGEDLIPGFQMRVAEIFAS